MPEIRKKIVVAKKVELHSNPPDDREIARELTQISVKNPDGSTQKILDKSDGIKSPPDERTPEQVKLERSSSMTVETDDGTRRRMITTAGHAQDHASYVFGITREAFHEIRNQMGALGLAELIKDATGDAEVREKMTGIMNCLNDAGDEMERVFRIPKDTVIKDYQSAEEVVKAATHATKRVITGLDDSEKIQATVGELPGTQGEYMDLLNTSVRLGKKIAHNHLCLLQGRPREEAVQLFDINGLVRETVAIFSTNPSMNLSIPARTDLSPEQLEVEADPDRTRQVLVNLMKNAAQSCDTRRKTQRDPPPEIIISSKTTPEGPVIQVTDNGMGIPPENLKKIFERDFTTKGEEGKGLGLHICEEILERYHAKLEVYSPGEMHGATLTIKFPKLE